MALAMTNKDSDYTIMIAVVCWLKRIFWCWNSPWCWSSECIVFPSGTDTYMLNVTLVAKLWD